MTSPTFSHRFWRSFIKLFLTISNSAYWISCALRLLSSSIVELAKFSPSSEPAVAAVKARYDHQIYQSRGPRLSTNPLGTHVELFVGDLIALDRTLQSSDLGGARLGLLAMTSNLAAEHLLRGVVLCVELGLMSVSYRPFEQVDSRRRLASGLGSSP